MIRHHLDSAILSRSATGLIVRVFGSAAALGFSVVVARKLGAAGTGLFFLALSVVTVFGVISKLGLDTAAVKIVGREWSESSKQRVAGLYLVIFAVSAVLGILIAILVWRMSGTVATGLFSKPDLLNPLRALAPMVPVLALIQIHAAFLRGCHRIGMSFSLQNVLVPTISIWILFVASSPATPAFVAEAYMVGGGITLSAGMIYWLRLQGVTLPEIEPRLLGELVRLAPPFFQSAIMNMVVMRWAAILFLGIWGTSDELGQFGAAARVAVALSVALMVANAVAAPQLARQFAEKNLAGMARTGATTTLFALVVASPLLIACLFFPSWLMSFFGPAFRSAGTILLVLSLGELMNVVVGPVGAMLQMSRHERVYRNCATGSAVILLGLCVMLIPRYGALGAAWATAISLAFTNLTALAFTYRLLGIIPIPFLASRLGAKHL